MKASPFFFNLMVPRVRHRIMPPSSSFAINPATCSIAPLIALCSSLLYYQPAVAITNHQPVSVNCASSGQICEPQATFNIDITAAGIFDLQYVTPDSHCSDVGVRFSIDGVVVGSTPTLAPGGAQGGIKAAIPTAGTHTVSVQGLGTEGGCNVGTLASWAGNVRVTSEKDPQTCPVGNPCNPASGNKYQREPDFEAPGTGLALVRHYNSEQAADFGLGVGWSSNLHKRFELVGTDAVNARRNDGRAEPFFCDATSCAGNADSDLILTRQGSDYLLILPDGAEEHYDAAGRLIREVDTFGKATTYAYDAGGNLQSVTGPFGHQVTFTYLDGRLQTMTDPAGRPYAYSYANGTLSQVTYPDGTTRIYGYSDPIYPHHLTRITDEDGHLFATFAYDAQGRAVSTAHAVTDNAGPQEQFIFQYDSNSQTTVTDARGTAQTWTFEERLNVRYPASRTNLVDLKGDASTYDGNGNLISHTDEEGRVTQHTYNETNQRISTTEAFGTPEARTTTFQYLSPDVDLVTEAASPSVFAPGENKTVTGYGPHNEVLSTSLQGFRPDGTPVSRTTGFS
jgi:YD repeat-containing protein